MAKKKKKSKNELFALSAVLLTLFIGGGFIYTQMSGGVPEKSCRSLVFEVPHHTYGGDYILNRPYLLSEKTLGATDSAAEWLNVYKANDFGISMTRKSIDLICTPICTQDEIFWISIDTQEREEPRENTPTIYKPAIKYTCCCEWSYP